MLAWGPSTLKELFYFSKRDNVFLYKISSMLFKSLANIIVRSKHKKKIHQFTKTALPALHFIEMNSELLALHWIKSKPQATENLCPEAKDTWFIKNIFKWIFKPVNLTLDVCAHM